MADPKLVKILWQGSEVWNSWRKKQLASLLIDLSNARLIDTNLSNANLSLADLSGAKMSNTDLSGTILIEANLSGADLRGANLFGADLNYANLSGTTLQKARVWHTIFASIDLREVKGLVEMIYEGPCRVELHTVLLPQDGSALHFLRGCGVPDEWIEDYRVRMMHPIQYYS